MSTIKCFKKVDNTGKLAGLIMSTKSLSELQEMQAKLTKPSHTWKYIIEECTFEELKGGSQNPYGVNMKVTLI